MWSALRSRVVSPSSSLRQCCTSLFPSTMQLNRSLCSASIQDYQTVGSDNESMNLFDPKTLLSLEEVKKILDDVRADDVQVFPVPKHLDFADFMVIATGRSTWHVRNIAQALIYKVKKKQEGAKKILLPGVEGQESGNWIVIDSGSLIIHAFEENVRPYYNLEKIFSRQVQSPEEQDQDLKQAFVKVRRKNNSKKKPVQKKE